jgi:Rrf2 family protein
MKISAKGRYAVRTVINLSKSQIDFKSVREVSLEEQISLVFLEKIFSNLKKAGIIKSERGAHGGFSLNRNTKDIYIIDILIAVKEDMEPTPCSSEKCGKECDISYFWNITKKYMTNYFSRVSIADIINKKIDI